MAYSLSNISAKNYENRLMFGEVVVCYISVVFWDTVCRKSNLYKNENTRLPKVIWEQEAFEKCWAHSPLRAAARRIAIHQVSPPAHRCPQQQRRRRRRQRQRVTEGTAMAPQNGPNKPLGSRPVSNRRKIYSPSGKFAERAELDLLTLHV